MRLKSILLMIYVIGCTFFIQAEKKVLQNGLDKYDGCEDSYLTEEGKAGDKNHGSEDQLNLRGGT